MNYHNTVVCPQYPYLEYVEYDYTDNSGFGCKSQAIWYNNNPILTQSDFTKVRNMFLSGYIRSYDDFYDTTSKNDRRVLQWLDRYFNKVDEWL